MATHSTTSRMVICPKIQNGVKCGKQGYVVTQQNKAHNHLYYVVVHKEKTKSGYEVRHYLPIEFMNTDEGKELAKIHRNAHTKTKTNTNTNTSAQPSSLSNQFESDVLWARKELKKVAKRKSDIIKQLAIRFEKKGMQLDMISRQIVLRLDGLVDDKYVYEVLPAKYKRSEKAHSKTDQSLVGKPSKTEQMFNAISDYSEQDLKGYDKDKLLHIIEEQKVEIQELEEMNQNQTLFIQQTGEKKEFWYPCTLTLNENAIEYARMQNMELPVSIHVDTIHRKADVFLDKTAAYASSPNQKNEKEVVAAI